MTDRAHPFRHLSAAEALRALYVDFEGEKDKRPVLLGVHRRGRGATPFVQQDVLDEGFAGLAGSCLSLHDAVEKVVRRAEHGDRRTGRRPGRATQPGLLPTHEAPDDGIALPVRSRNGEHLASAHVAEEHAAIAKGHAGRQRRDARST